MGKIPKKKRSRKKRTRTTEITDSVRKKLLEIHRKRSKRSRSLDERYAGKVPAYVETWMRNPGKYDIPGVDLGKVKRKGKRRKSAYMIFKELTHKLVPNLKIEKKGDQKSGRWHITYALADWSWKEYKRVETNLREIKKSITERTGKQTFIRITKKPVKALVDGEYIQYNIKIGVAE